jgi:hypothetical protein
MVVSVLCLLAAALLLCCGWFRRERPLDAEELRTLRRFSDELRKQQIHPFE